MYSILNDTNDTNDTNDVIVKITFDDFSPLFVCLFAILFIFIFFSCVYLIIIIIDCVYKQFLDIYRYYNLCNNHRRYEPISISNTDVFIDNDDL